MSDFARDLGYPLSSASELLHYLVHLGYLDYDPAARRYSPTPKVALLGAWVQPGFFRHGHLLSMMDEISQRTGELVALSCVIGLSVQYIHHIAATNPVCLCIPHGHRTPLLRSAHGRLFLSTYSETRIRQLIRRINSEEPNPEKHVRWDELEPELQKIRQLGYALSLDSVAPGSGMVALLLRTPNNGPHLALGVGGVSTVIEQNAEMYLEIMHEAAVNNELADAIEHYLPKGPVSGL
jgi:DNA-binding IclR family transcriptional regulator